MANTRFDWDTDKNAENQQKHGVSFTRAQFAFADPQRVIAKDITHSQTEERYYHGRLMKEWLAVEPSSNQNWLALAKEALEFASR